MKRTSKKPEAPKPIEWAGWFSVCEHKHGVFWASWWTGEPIGDLWRSPDAVGITRPSAKPSVAPIFPGDLRAFAEADAEGAIRKAKGPVAARRVDDSFAAAAMRERDGKPAAYEPPAPSKGPGKVFYTTRDTSVAWRAAAYWRRHDEAVLKGERPFPPSMYKLQKQPKRPKDMPEPPEVRAEIAAKYPRRRARDYWVKCIAEWTFGRPPPDPRDFGFDAEPEPIDAYTRALAALIREERAARSSGAGEPPRSSVQNAVDPSGYPSAAFKLLGLDRNATRADVRRAFAERALKTHPDHGGDGDMGKLVAAKDAVMAFIERRSVAA